MQTKIAVVFAAFSVAIVAERGFATDGGQGMTTNVDPRIAALPPNFEGYLLQSNQRMRKLRDVAVAEQRAYWLPPGTGTGCGGCNPPVPMRPPPPPPSLERLREMVYVSIPAHAKARNDGPDSGRLSITTPENTDYLLIREALEQTSNSVSTARVRSSNSSSDRISVESGERVHVLVTDEQFENGRWVSVPAGADHEVPTQIFYVKGNKVVKRWDVGR